MQKLTLKQQRFINFYEGNATEAAIKAGYSKKTAFSIGVENLSKPLIADAISKRNSQQDAPTIATRKQRQEFWTNVMNDRSELMINRLRAAELLGKSEADFLERYEHTLKEYKYDDFKDKTDDELAYDFRSLGIGCKN